jgi:tRNA G18 (ribose-2'-O)-methylase SpoU
LTDASRRRAIEDSEGVFVVEGARAIRELIVSSWPVRSVLLRPERVAAMSDVVAAAAGAGAPVYIASQRVFDGIAGFPVHRGVLALGARAAPRSVAEVLANTSTALVVEGVNDHENLGALFRNAAALGAGAVLLDPETCDPLYRRSVRVSVGHVLRVPFSRVSPWPQAIGRVRDEGFVIVALHPAATGSIEQAARDTSAAGKVAVLVGGEATGLSPGALSSADVAARIPMAGGVDSLNVATAAAIALHRLARV